MSKVEPTCNCIEIVDAKLAERNTRLTRALVFNPMRERLMIETEVVEKRRGAKAVGMFPSFCPFCGVAYEGDEATKPASAEAA